MVAISGGKGAKVELVVVGGKTREGREEGHSAQASKQNSNSPLRTLEVC